MYHLGVQEINEINDRRDLLIGKAHTKMRRGLISEGEFDNICKEVVEESTELIELCMTVKTKLNKFFVG